MTNTPNETQSYESWFGANVYDSTGDKVGSIDQIYLDDQTGQPEWLTVSTGWFGTSTQFVPIAGTSRHDDGLKVPYTTDHIKDAPSVDGEEHLDADEEHRLYQHYGLVHDATDHEQTYGGRERADEGFDYYDTADAGTAASGTGTTAEVTRAEEQLEVDKVERQAGSVRLRKYVVEEDVNVTVPVKKQVARIVRTDAGGAAGAAAGGSIADEEVVDEVTLAEEEIVVDKNVVEKERVGIETETVTEEREVADTVRKERVEVEGDVDDPQT